MVTCLDTVMWSPDPEAIECTPLTQPPPTSGELMSAVHKDVVTDGNNFSPSNELHCSTVTTKKWQHQ